MHIVIQFYCRGDHWSPASVPIYLRLPPVKGGAAERRRRDCYRVKKIEKDRTQPLSHLAVEDVFRFRSRNRRRSADEEKLRETLCVSYSSPLAQGSRITHQPCRARRPRRSASATAQTNRHAPSVSRRARDAVLLILYIIIICVGMAAFAAAPHPSKPRKNAENPAENRLRRCKKFYYVKQMFAFCAERRNFTRLRDTKKDRLFLIFALKTGTIVYLDQKIRTDLREIAARDCSTYTKKKNRRFFQRRKSDKCSPLTSFLPCIIISTEKCPRCTKNVPVG